MHALRTTLIIGAFWLLVILSGGYYVHLSMRSQQKELQAKEKKVREQLEATEELASNLPSVQAELESVKNLWQYRSKAIPREETSHETYDYIDKILTRQKSSLNFDYISAGVLDSAGVRSANYQLVGEAQFVDLYRFIWYVEHLPRYLRINSLQLTENQTVAEDGENIAGEQWVHFDMSITALSADRQGFDEVQYAADINEPKGSHDPFEPPAKSVVTVPANDMQLPNVFESSLKALTPTQAYVLDQSGELKVLNIGDQVYLGSLIDILPDENRAVFNLDQLFPPRQVSLQIKTGK